MHNHYISIQSMRAGWTMIELVFIIVIMGILAAGAIPKFTAIRDDALLSKDVSNMSNCILDLGTQYVATGIELAHIDSSSCDQVTCYIQEINVSSMRVDLNTSAPGYCDDILNVGQHLIGTYEFAGTTIVR